MVDYQDVVLRDDIIRQCLFKLAFEELHPVVGNFGNLPGLRERTFAIKRSPAFRKTLKRTHGALIDGASAALINSESSSPSTHQIPNRDRLAIGRLLVWSHVRRALPCWANPLNVVLPHHHHRTVGYNGPTGTSMDLACGPADSHGLIESPDVAFAIPTLICNE
jgi:hypothetical protein